MPDDDNDTRTIEEKVLDLQDQVEALHGDIREANFPIQALFAIVAQLISDPSYRNRLAIEDQFRGYLREPIIVKEDGGGGD